jgi:hypothetical protein
VFDTDTHSNMSLINCVCGNVKRKPVFTFSGSMIINHDDIQQNGLCLDTLNRVSNLLLTFCTPYLVSAMFFREPSMDGT